MILPIQKKDIAAVAKIHRDNLPSVISFYGQDFIERFYRFHLVKKVNKSIFLGAFENDILVGFVFGTYDLDALFDDFIKQNKWYFFTKTMKAIFSHPVYFVHLFGKITGKKTASNWQTQLVYIAVNKKQNGKGIGKQLIEHFENEAKKEVDYYELEVEKNNAALSFYKKNNFEIVEEINSILEKKYLMGKKLK